MMPIAREDMSSVNPNVLEMYVPGEVARPYSSWRVVAKVSYQSSEEMVLSGEDYKSVMVPFDVHFGDIKPPLVRLYAPNRVTNALCSFVLDASKSRPREPLFWSSTRRLQEAAPTRSSTRRLLAAAPTRSSTRHLQEVDDGAAPAPAGDAAAPAPAEDGGEPMLPAPGGDGGANGTDQGRNGTDRQ